jgi:hypothetical protein
MSSSQERKPNYRRRFMWLGVFIVLLFGGYSAAWFYGAAKLEAVAAQAIAGLNRNGTSADCANPVARGFPFRIGLYCDSVRFEDTPQKVAASAAAFRSAAQVYDPFQIVAELDSPARLSVPGGADFAFNWSNLRAGARLSMDFPEHASAEVTSLTAEANPGAAAATSLFSIGAAEAHMRKSGDDLDLAASFADADIDPKLLNGGDLPPIAGQADLTIKDGVNLVRFGKGSLRGHSGTIRMLSISSGEAAGLSLTGPFSVASDGLVDADLTVTVRDPQALSVLLAKAFPTAAGQIRASFAGLAALGDSPTMPLKVSKGRATLGFIPLGELPPL